MPPKTPPAGYTISCNRDDQHIETIHAWLHNAYWCRGIPLETVRNAFHNSLPFGIFTPHHTQVACARVVTDYATFAWLCDVIVAPEARGQGLGSWLVQAALDHPDLQNLRRFLLATADAHSLYAKHGFQPTQNPDRWMEIQNNDIYSSNKAKSLSSRTP